MVVFNNYFREMSTLTESTQFAFILVIIFSEAPCYSTLFFCDRSPLYIPFPSFIGYNKVTSILAEFHHIFYNKKKTRQLAGLLEEVIRHAESIDYVGYSSNSCKA